MANTFLKKVIATSFAVTVAASAFTSSASAAISFSDIEKGQSHYESVTALATAGFVGGYSDGSFGVNNDMLRQHGAILFKGALKLEVPDNYEEVLAEYYTDVDASHPYATQIAAVTPSIFRGSLKKFSPGDDMTREQMATTIVKALGLEDNGKETAINLSNVGASHKENVKIFAQYGITNQLDDFRPRESVKRGQFATFLLKALQAATPHTVELKDGLLVFQNTVEVTLDVPNPQDYKVYVDAEQLAFKNGKHVAVMDSVTATDVQNSLLIVKNY